MIRIPAFILLFAVLAIGCQSQDAVPTQQALADLEPNALILDVRTPGEYAAGHLQDAVLVNYMASDFREQVSQFDRERPVYLYCGSGARSGRAAAILTELGFEKAVNLGGYQALKAAGAPVVD